MDATLKSPKAMRVGTRLSFIDNLRWTMIFLVISMHAADTYSPLGNWYFTDRTPLSPPVLLFFAAWQMYLQSFFMGLLFFIAGSFVPLSFDRKGAVPFMRERAFRLGLPVLFYMFVLGPVTEYYVAHSWTSTKPTSLANEWIKHIRNGEFLQENGPLWFCLALLIFSLAYVALRAGNFTAPDTKVTAPPTASSLIGFALAMAAITFLVRAVKPPTFLNMHLGDFPQYVFLFTAGVLSARRGWLSEVRSSLAVRWVALVLPIGFAAWFAILVFGGGLDWNGHTHFGGWNWRTAAICLWESFTCVAVSVGLLTFYRARFHSQNRMAKFLSDNAFSVYVFHPPIVILAARVLHDLSWHPLFKFLILTAIGVVGSFALSAAIFRRLPLLRHIL